MTTETPRRTVRVEDELWDAAKEKAAQQGSNLSTILRERLEELVQS
jgi:predicted DNA binding CopG/RHH family protein